MKKMKAALFYEREDIRVEEVNLPEIEKDEILMEVRACGICGSDCRTYFGGLEERYKSPVILGHEIVGEVAQVGEKVNGFSIGNRVVLAPIYGCGRCSFCVSGQENLCSQVVVFGCNVDGGFAEYMKITADAIRQGGLVKIPQILSDEVATLIEPFSCCLHGILEAKVKLGDTVMVIGAGPIGLAHIKLLKLLGMGQIIASDIVDSRLERAINFGADFTVNSKNKNFHKKVRELSNGRGADAVIVAIGNPQAIMLGLESVKKGGVVVLFGGCPSGSSLQIDPNIIHYSEMKIVGSIDSTISEFQRMVLLLSKMETKPFITHRFPLELIKEGMEIAKSKKGLKVIITF